GVKTELRETHLQCADQSDKHADGTPSDAGPDKAAHDLVVIGDAADLSSSCYFHGSVVLMRGRGEGRRLWLDGHGCVVVERHQAKTVGFMAVALLGAEHEQNDRADHECETAEQP